MKKKILAALLACAMLLSVAGCEQSDKPGTTTGSGSGEGTKAPAGTQGSDEGTKQETPPPSDSTDYVNAEVNKKDDPQMVDTGFKNPDGEGKKFRIAVWNDEWQKFFQKYYKVPEGVEVEWVVTPNDGGAYQKKLDEMLQANADASADDKIDLFLAEADYIKKYACSDYTMSLKDLGLERAATAYSYTYDACTDTRNNETKGASFQATPNVLIYRKSIAKDVLGTDDPAEVQSKLDSWDKFNAVAKDAKAKGYYMTPSAIETYRVYANNSSKSFITDGKFTLTDGFDKWLAQAEEFSKNGYTINCGVWADEKTAQMSNGGIPIPTEPNEGESEEDFKARVEGYKKINEEFGDNCGKTLCFFGPAWYYNFCMGVALEHAAGDWAICEGPQAAFWGGTWMMVPTGTDNASMAADVLKAFTENTDILTQLVMKDNQYANHKNVMKSYAESKDYQNKFLVKGQNDIAIMYKLAENIKWDADLHTQYDQTFNEKLPEQILEYLKGSCTKEEALNNFYKTLDESCPGVTHD